MFEAESGYVDFGEPVKSTLPPQDHENPASKDKGKNEGEQSHHEERKPFSASPRDDHQRK